MNDRRHNDPQSPHERARLLASDRLDGPLAPEDAAWLTEHLAGCVACDEIATAYAADRELLRSMPLPQPPRDLWARTSVAIARERAAGTGSSAAARARRQIRWDSRLRWESMAGVLAVLLVGVVVGRTLLGSGSPIVTPNASGNLPTVAGASSGAEATPLAVNAGDVAWAAPRPDGSYDLQVANVTAVCADDAVPSSVCAPIDTGAQQMVRLTSRPGSVVIAPKAAQAVVVESSASTTGGSIIVIAIRRATPAPTPSPTTSPTASPIASASGHQTPGPTTKPTTSPTATPSPTTKPTASPTASAIPSGAPSSTAAAMLAIINDVIVVGGDAAYSPDGEWLAFSARPADGSHGPDVYVWHADDSGSGARPITTDHASVFSDWVDGRILASRAVPSPVLTDAASAAPVSATAVSMLLEPSTGKVHGSTTMPGVWRPVVDPNGQWAAYWKGSLIFDPVSGAFIPDQGSLVIANWADLIAGNPGGVDGSHPLLDRQADGPILDWEVRWDPTGRYLGVWVADPLNSSLGRLGLITIDPTSGMVDPEPKSLLRDTAALPGFAVGDGRIVWATPPGQDGEGSRLFLLAWKGKDAGQVKSLPAPSQEDMVVAH